jgi:UDP-glucose 4-epimerase
VSRALLIGGNGYIGSRLALQLEAYSIPFSIVDKHMWGLEHNYDEYVMDMRMISKDFLKRYTHIILLAGASSVPMAKASPIGAIKDNVVYFQQLLDMMEDQSLIYASSGGVYTGHTMATEETVLGRPTNIYDATKKWIDEIASMSNKNTYGLRFGTVNGWSPNLRLDLMINKMYHSDILRVQNAWAERSILDISDAVEAIVQIMIQEPDPGVYNVCSFSATVGEIAEAVSAATGQQVIYEGDTPGVYTFSFSTEKLSKIYLSRGTLITIVDSLSKESQFKGNR